MHCKTVQQQFEEATCSHEVAAHLDPGRRAALFDRLRGRGQVWMTATEPALFADIGPSASRFHVEGGTVHAT